MSDGFRMKTQKKLYQDKPLIIGVKGNKIDVSVSGVRVSQEVSEDQLNKAKEVLDPYYENASLRRTQEITNSLDVYRDLLRTVRTKYGAQFPTNAWSKYIELYSIVDKIIRDTGLPGVLPEDKEIVAFCNAELPGSSICALNHYLTCMDKSLSWMASSYRPDGEGTMLGDYYGLYAGNKEKWLMNDPDFNGDMTNVLGVKKCISLYRKSVPDGCMIYSHDAGLDVTKDVGPWKAYSDQERMNMKLHLGCAIVGLETLRETGTFIAKQYTLYEKNSQDLIKLYSEFFEQFYLIKPMTSRPYNSESYLVGIKFHRPKNADSLLKQMYDLLDSEEMSIVSKNGPAEKTLILDGIMDLEYKDAAINSYMSISAGRQVIFLEEIVDHLKRNKTGPVNDYGKKINTWLTGSGLCPIQKSSWLPFVDMKK